MNEPKHTPGPYRLVRETDDSRPCRLYVRAGNRTLLASAEDTPEVAAQFQLFAAAPEMLEALEFIAKQYDESMDSAANSSRVISLQMLIKRALADRLYDASCTAKAAIAKAEGEQQ